YQVELVMPEPIAHSIVPGRSAIVSAIAALAIMIAGIVFATRDRGTTVPSVPDPASVETIEQASADIPAPPEADIPSPVDTAVAPAIEPPPAPEEAPMFEGAPPEPTPAETADAAPTPAEPTAATLPETTTASLPTEAPPAAASPQAAMAQTRLVLEALQSSWVEIKDAKGIVLFTNILKEGQLLPIPDQEGVTLTTGNAGGLRVILDGQALQPLGKNNEVKRGVVLDPKNFSAR